MAFLGFNFKLEEQLAFYGAYHNHWANQVIHFIFVPLIYWTALVWLAYTPALVAFDLPGALEPALGALASGFVLNATVVVYGLYAVYYLTLDFVAGLAWAMCIGLPIWATANLFQQSVPDAWAWALGLHVFAWYMQIHPGHLVIEGRKPALLDSFFQSLVLAPLFVLYELLFLMGYRPALKAELQRRIEADIAVWKASQGAAATAQTPLLSKDAGVQDQQEGKDE